MLSVTGEDVDLSNIDYANVKHVGIDPGTSVSNANVPEDVTVDNFGAINGGTFAGEVRLLDTGTISGTGTINAGDFTQATFSNFTGTINCGTFGGYTIADGTLTITAPIEVTDDMLASISTVNVTATGEITGGTLNGDASMETMTVDACGMISGGTFSGKMVVHNRGEIAGGTLNGTVWNYATISGGTFKGYIGNFAEGCVIRGKSAGSLKIDCGIGYYSGIPAQLFQPCEFGPKATVSVENNEGTIEVTMTVNGVDVTFEYNDKILESLTEQFGEGDWYAVAGETQTPVDETMTFGLQKQSYACAHYVGTDDEGKKVLYITTPTAVTDEMLEGISTVVVAAGGAITGGELNGDASMDEVIVDVDGGVISGGTFSGKMSVRNRNQITGGTFNGYVWNYATISGGTFNGGIGNSSNTVIQGADGGSLRIDCAIQYYDESSAQILQPCAFGPNASISPADVEGTIQVSMTVNGANRTFQYGENVLTALNGIASGADWCAVEGDTRTPVEAEAAFGLQSRSYNYTYYVDGYTLYITAPVVFSQDMLPDGVWKIMVTATGSILDSDGAVAANVGVQPGGAISGGEFTDEVYNDGTISGGTFSCPTTNASGLISGGTFSGEVKNMSRISGGVFDGTVVNSNQNSLIQGDDKTTPALNGEIVNETNNGVGTPRILQPCDFGPEASVTSNEGTIEVVMTVNGADTTFEYGEKILPALEEAVGAGAWCLEEGDTRTPVEAGDAFGLQKRSYVSTYYASGNTLYITAPTEVTDDMLAGISTVNVTATGEITGGTLNGDASMETVTVDVRGVISGGTFSSKMVVHNRSEITGGTFNGTVWNYATISGGIFKGYIGNLTEGDTTPVIRGKSAGGLKIDCGIGYYSGIPAQIFQPCEFGPNASVNVENNEGTIEVVVTVDDVETVVNYGADILKTLGASSTGLWYRVNADGTRSLVKEGEAFASLQKEAYTSQVLLPTPKIEIDYINESWSVTLTEEEVPEGVDVTAMDINFALSGEEYAAYANMPGLSGSWGLNLIGGIWGITFPTDKDTTLEIFYSFAVTDANGNETDVAYGERVEWVIPARPDINVDTVYPGYNEMTVTFDTEPYNVYLQSVKEPEKYFYDEDDGVVDGCIHGLTEGTEYAIIFRKLATEASFASYPYTLKSTRTTLTRTRLSVEAAETSWSWRPGFSLTAEDCFAAQVTLQGEKELPEKGKFTLSAVNEYGEPVSFPLTNAGTYTVTASLAEDVANDYRLENGGVFTVTIDPMELPAPVLTLDYGAEIIAIAELPETLPEGIEWESLWIDIFANDAGIAKLPPVLTVGSWFTLSDLGYWYGETLPAAAGKEDAVLSFCFSIEGYEGNIVGQAAELVIPARPEADAPDSDARANAVTWNSIQMLDQDMLAVYDFGVALRGDELPAEPTFVDEDGDGLITGLAEDTEYCLYFRKKATDSSFRSEWYARSDIWVSTYRRPALSAGAEAAEYTWTPDAALDIGEEMVSTSVEDGTERSVPADDYALTITDASGAQVTGAIRDVGTYTVKVTMESGSYVLAEGKDTFTATVRPLDLSRDDVALILPDGRVPMPVYSGESVYPQLGDNMIEVEVGGVGRGALPADCFTIEAAEGRNDINAGAAYLTIVGQGNATGEAELAYIIIAKSIAAASVNVKPIGELVYTGAAFEPPVTVKDGEKALVEGEDYEVTFEENTDAGTVTVTITGMGNYSGETEVTFEIVKATAPAIQWPEVTGGLTYGQKVAEIPLSAMEDANGAFVWKCPDCVPGVGEFLFTLVYIPDNADNYDYTGVPLECEVCVEVAPKDISTLTVDAIPTQTATGSALTPAVTVRHGDAVLAAGTDYTVTYTDNTAVGTATVTITGMGNYTGTLTATFATREAEKEEDEKDESTTEALTPAQQAEALASGEAVDGTVTDRHGEAAGYVPSTEEVTDEETQEVLERTLVIAADPLLDEDGQPILRDGKPVYEQRNLNLSRGLLDALAELGYTHIRFALGDAALEWQIADMTEESYVVRLAPMETNELSQAEKEAIGAAETLAGSYRVRITAMIEGKETDVTNLIPSLTVIFDAASVRELTVGEAAQLLLIPNDGEPEAQVSTVQYIEATDTEPARYEAPLTESGLFALALQ